MSNKRKFEKLLSPYKIGSLQIKNRIVRPAAIMYYVDKEGFITAKHKSFYGALARGGAGLVIIGGCCIDYPLGLQDPGMVRIDDDKYIPGFRELAQEVHKYGGKIFAQILHAGPSHPTRITGIPPVASSKLEPGTVPLMSEISFLPKRKHQDLHELTIPELKEIIKKFGDAAVRLKQAGIDGIEINGASSHLLNTFLSRVWNKRHDEYGCDSLENRSRFFVEVFQEVRKRVGPDYPVTVRFNGSEFGREECTKVEEAQEFARIFEKAGADAIHIVAIGYGPPDCNVWHWNEQVFYPEAPDNLAPGLDWSRKGAGATIPIVAAIKKVVSIPIMTVGRLDPVLGEKLLQEGKADFIGLQRRLMADPELPNKLAAGKLDEIVPCTACLQCLDLEIPVPCRINAALGGDEDYKIPPAEKKKRVLVVGGGPGGMEAARVAAIRGHEVILYEKEPKLGGLVPMAAMVKGTSIEDLPALVRYYKTQLSRLGVKVHLGKEFKAELIDQIKPDAIILASGGKNKLPDLPGINKKIVVGGPALHHMLKNFLKIFDENILRWLTNIWMPIGKRVVVIGGDIQGCELAEFLVMRGRKVTIVDTSEKLGDKLPLLKMGRLFDWFNKKGVTMIPGVKIEAITDEGLSITNKEGLKQFIEADSVVTALPLSPDTELIDSLKAKVKEVYPIGDVRKPGLIIGAIVDGYHIARAI